MRQPLVMTSRTMYAHTAHRPAGTSNSVLAPTVGEISALIALAAFYMVSDTVFGERSYAVVNIVGPLLLNAILGYGGWLLIRSDGKNLWMALFWFRLSTIVYFGVGTFSIFIMDAFSRQYLESFFLFSDQDVFKVNLVVTVSAILVLASARVAVLLSARRSARRRPATATQIPDPERKFKSVAVVFLAVGLTINYTLKAPYDMGWISVEIPGSIVGLARLTLIGIFMLTLWSLVHVPRWLPAITAFMLIESLFQLLLLSKAGALFPLVMFLLAFLWNKVTIRRLVICSGLVILAFGSLKPLVEYARQELEQRHGEQPQAGFIERAEILQSYFGSATPEEATNTGSTALTRISYVNTAAFVIQRYDSGYAADWPNLLPAVFIPRFLWPDKPIISDIAKDIYELSTGRRTSQVGAGLFADAYWAMGWWGIIVFMPIYGLILGVLTVMSAKLLQDGRWLFFPVVLLALHMGFRTDGHYITDVAGAAVILAGYFAVLYVVEIMVKALAKPVPISMGAVSQRAPLRSAAGSRAEDP